MFNNTHVSYKSTLGLLLSVLLPACAGKGDDPEAAAPVLAASCARCHDAGGIARLVADVRALPDAELDELRFPIDAFPEGLRHRTAGDLRRAADPADDAGLDPAMSDRKAWVLHELHELKTLLAEPIPPDYTSVARFAAFARQGLEGQWEACEVSAKLDLGSAEHPRGMPPLWAAPLFERLGRDLPPVTSEDREQLKAYASGLVPGGLPACLPAGEYVEE